MGGAASRVGRGPQLVTGQDATARGRSGASTGVRDGQGADGLGSQDCPRGRTCGCSCPNARRTRSGRRATPPGPGPGSAGRRCQQTGFPMAPARPHGPVCTTTPSLGGQVLCQTRRVSRDPVCLGWAARHAGLPAGRTGDKCGWQSGYNAPEREEARRGSAPPPAPEYCCAVPGTRTWSERPGGDAQRPGLTPREDAVFISCQCRNGSPRPGQGGRGGVQAGETLRSL